MDSDPDPDPDSDFDFDFDFEEGAYNKPVLKRRKRAHELTMTRKHAFSTTEDTERGDGNDKESGARGPGRSANGRG